MVICGLVPVVESVVITRMNDSYGFPGGAEGTRTPDFLLAKEALSRLSYSPRLTYKL